MHNPQTVDLLVSLAYCSASDGSMDEPFPSGLGLRVPPPGPSAPSVAQTAVYALPGVTHQPPPPEVPKELTKGPDGLCDFDDLTVSQVGLQQYLFFLLENDLHILSSRCDPPSRNSSTHCHR